MAAYVLVQEGLGARDGGRVEEDPAEARGVGQSSEVPVDGELARRYFMSEDPSLLAL
jgi:hypothetical protein